MTLYFTIMCLYGQNVFKFVGKHFCYLESKFCFRNFTMFPEIDKQGNIDKKHAYFLGKFAQGFTCYEGTN